MRGDRGASVEEAPSLKRSLSDEAGISPERKRHAPSWMGFDKEYEIPKASQVLLCTKDVPSWSMEEDLFIMDQVERFGKRWSKIAAQMPGRTDNGVRNRWNRMEKAQSLREARGARPGYRCRRCGLPKRGHTCKALSTAADATEAPDVAAGMGARVAAAAFSYAGSGESALRAPPRPGAFVFGSRPGAERASPSSLGEAAPSAAPALSAHAPRVDSRAVVPSEVEEGEVEGGEVEEAAEDDEQLLLPPTPQPRLAPPHGSPSRPLEPGVRALEEAIQSPGLLDEFLRDLQLSLRQPFAEGFGEQPPGAPLLPMAPPPMSHPLAAGAPAEGFLLDDYACLYAPAGPAPHPAATEYVVPRSPRALGAY